MTVASICIGALALFAACAAGFMLAQGDKDTIAVGAALIAGSVIFAIAAWNIAYESGFNDSRSVHCPSCGAIVEDAWEYCPVCGEEAR